MNKDKLINNKCFIQCSIDAQNWQNNIDKVSKSHNISGDKAQKYE